MDLLEYRQLKLALKALTGGEKMSDFNVNDFIKDFQVIGRLTYEAQAFENPNRTYGNGCTEQQLNIIQAVLFSAGFYYEKIKKNLASQKMKFGDAFLNDKYNGKTLEDYEDMRIMGAHKIKNTDRLTKKLQIEEKTGAEIYAAVEKLAEHKFIKNTAVKFITLNAAKNMIEDGVSLTEITNCLKTDLLTVYNLAKSMGIPFKLSPQEENLVKKTLKTADKISEQNRKTEAGLSAVSEDNSVIVNYAYM